MSTAQESELYKEHLKAAVYERQSTSHRYKKKNQQKFVYGGNTNPMKYDKIMSAKQPLTSIHRTKRYLIFPESSSFQLIFDLIIGVVDYTKFAILGITCAVAWELPSKPPSEIIEHVRQELFKGTIALQRRNYEMSGTLDSMSGVSHYHKNSELLLNNHTSKSNGNISKVAYYDHTQLMYDSDYKKRYIDFGLKHKKTRGEPNRDKNLHNRTSNTTPKIHAYPNLGRNVKVRRDTKHRILKKPPKPTIRFVFGKLNRRRRGMQLDGTSGNSHTREHLASRDKLYRKIELIFKRSGHNGTACILRALCETANTNHMNAIQRSKPQGFITELLRAIFTLPVKINVIGGVQNAFIATNYLEAFKHCNEIDKYCGYTIWRNKFVN